MIKHNLYSWALYDGRKSYFCWLVMIGDDDSDDGDYDGCTYHDRA
jgi:hypothetical protein